MFTEAWRERIREQAREMEYTKAIPSDILTFMYEQKLFKLFVPEELGGKMLSLPEALRVFQKASAVEGNFGWLTTIGSGGGMFVPFMDTEWAEKLFSPNHAVLAGSGHPNGVAAEVDGGYIVNGEWKYCSGSPFASFFTANNKLKDGEILSFILMPEQVEIVEDWNAFGLKATGSHSIKVNNAFVPKERTFSIFGEQNQYANPIYTFPFVQFSQSSFTAVCFGITESFYEETNRIVEKRMSSAGERFKLVSEAVKKHEDLFSKSTSEFYSEVEKLWGDHLLGKTLDVTELEHFSQICKRSVKLAIDGTNSLIRQLGMEAIMEDSKLNKIWRDLYTAGQHSFISS
ncbi:acyl-CoA dehydrogenase family protein [Bacillus niameyensis]|uniref:acyl-CoA dehydrogenase family protein n=1 Tax=Bacillus niameyensis TaxID=1522308 RepID=UPI0007815246|nr:acyl-CoA dehydrogenase family protein [Bacillus niameyensis]